MNLLNEKNKSEPCRVCGESNSGFHLGTVTCEACKVKILNMISYCLILINFNDLLF